MEILYSIINFLILAGLILLIGRKMIVSIFRDRREKILQELEEAESVRQLSDEKVEAIAIQELADETRTIEPEPNAWQSGNAASEKLSAAPQLVDAAEQVRQENETRIRKLQSYEETERTEITLSRVRKERKALAKKFEQDVIEKYRNLETSEFEAERDRALIRRILTYVTLTDGDRAYLRHHDVLYVTLSSAYPLPEELEKTAESEVASMVGAIGGRISFRKLVDQAMIGGLRLRIGDTVYDGSVAEILLRVKKSFESISPKETDTMEVMNAQLLQRIVETKQALSIYQVGRVISVSDGICWMDGLADIMYGEIVEFECGEHGMIMDIQRDRIGCAVFGSFEQIESYSRVRRAGRIASVPVGDALLGRVVDAIGHPLDGKGTIVTGETRPIEYPAPAIMDREAVSRPLHTGIKAIDAMVPIGKGQRELLVGDRQTGKTAIVLDTILNQKGKNVICIYAGIGQKETTIADLREKLEHYGAMEYTIIVSGTASESAAMQYIAPFAATAMGEYYMYAGRDVLMIYDDLSKHAVAYRELSLLLMRPSGREAYPGDIFYLHSRLLERSAQLSKEKGGGSMTALPIIETQAGDISSYIPTNVISITDGQIFLESDLFHEGQRPAINVGLSVSRVGGAAQTKLMKQVSSSLRTKLAQYRELAEFTQFGADVDEETRQTLTAGRHLTEALKQNCYSPLEDWEQALLLYAVSERMADSIEITELADWERQLFCHFEMRHPDLVEAMKSGRKMDVDLIGKVRSAVSETVK